MNINNALSTTQVYDAVWQNAPRSITNLASAGVAFGNVAFSLPAATTTDFRPALGSLRTLSCSCNATAGGNVIFTLYNGTSTGSGGIVNGAGGTAGLFTFVGNSSIGLAVINNAPATAAVFSYTGWDWT